MRCVASKFGGSSLADAAQFIKVRDIILQDPARRFIVVSAPGKRFEGDVKVTDLLDSCREKAQTGADFTRELDVVKQRFVDIAGALVPGFELDGEFDTIRRVLKAMPYRDYALSRGEYLCAKLMAAYLGFDFIDPAQYVHFNETGELNEEWTNDDLACALTDLKGAVIAGFYGSLPNGAIKTFSRGGSDITGALVARAVNADIYENWTDVSGLLAADPRIVDDPRTVEHISYRELRILSYMGASVLHTDCVRPVSLCGIPINIRNTNRPQDAGTLIVSQLPEKREERAVTGVAGRKGLSVVQVEKSMVSDGAGFTAVLLDIFKSHRVPFEQCLTGIDTISIVIRGDLFAPAREEIMRDIETQLKPDTLFVRENLAMITVVGENTTRAHAVTVNILSAVAAAGIRLSTINQGAGNLNLIIGVEEEDYAAAIRAIYGVIKTENLN